jgi:fructose-specific phosphotransferase system IIA component
MHDSQNAASGAATTVVSEHGRRDMSIRITDFLPAELVRAPLRETAKVAVITELVDLLSEHGHTRDRDALLSAVLEREAQRTTGVGRGLAIPHAKTPVCPELIVALGRTSAPIDFQAIDGNPVQLVVLLAGPPNQTGQHLKILAQLSRLVLNDAVVKSLLDASDAAALYEIIKRHDDVG